MRVAIRTLGCKVNQYDTAVIERAIAERGYAQVDFGDEADAYIVNSCTVTDRADGESRQLARRARRTNPHARVILTGCYAQVSPAEISALDYVDYVVGLGRVPDLLGAVAGELDTPVAVSDLRHADRVETLGIASFSGRTRAFVKVQEGCNLFCTFCIVPVARGRSRSVEPRTVVDEIERLSARGFHEVVLTGVHLGGYGDDLEPRIELADLVDMIVERRPIARLRISSVDPPELGPRLFDAVSGGDLVCPHFHVPLQAADDGVLERMRRQYTFAEAARAIAGLRDRIPDVTLGTDIIAGFPGETDDEFRRGLARVEELELSYLHVFPYSQRQSTSAAKRWKPLDGGLIRERAAAWRDLDGKLRARHLARFVGCKARVLFENTRSADGRLRGHTEHYVPVTADGPDAWMNSVQSVRLSPGIGGRLEARLP